MCRVMMYSGRSMLIDDLLFKPSSSLIRQTIDPKQLGVLNLGGFGLVSWDPASNEPNEPFVYRSTTLPMFDRNLKSIATKVRTTSLLAHVRGIPLHNDANHGEHNLHPFRYDGFAWAMAHNGDLVGFAQIRHALQTYLEPKIAERMAGNTDSEAVYALVMSQLADPVADRSAAALADAILWSLRILRQLRHEAGHHVNSAINLFCSNGVDTVATRFAFDFGCYPIDDPALMGPSALSYLSLWYTVGESYREVDGQWRMTGDPSAMRSVLVASEPLSLDPTGWVEVPEYTMLVVEREARRVVVRTVAIDV